METVRKPMFHRIPHPAFIVHHSRHKLSFIMSGKWPQGWNNNRKRQEDAKKTLIDRVDCINVRDILSAAVLTAFRTVSLSILRRSSFTADGYRFTRHVCCQ